MCAAFCDQSTSRAERAALLREAVDNHARISYEALLGQGWDRHLFALRKLAEKSSGGTLPIFSDRAYSTLSDIVLSTSTLVHPALHAGGFGPPGPNTYGIMYLDSSFSRARYAWFGCNVALIDRYTLTPEMARCGVASYRDSAGLVRHLDQSFSQFRDVLGSA